MHKSAFLPLFGSRLAKARAAAGLSQANVANVIRVHRQTVYLWEAGRQAPDVWRVRQLCEALSVVPTHLLGLGDG